jgi:hypothetical protein
MFRLLVNMGDAGHPARARINITEHDAIPEKFSPNLSGMTQLRSVFVFSEVENA